MKVFKFGGASVKSAEGIKNLLGIVKAESGGEKLFVIVSAMGKTTNALEIVTDNFMKGDKAAALDTLALNQAFHNDIAQGLFGEKTPECIGDFFAQIKNTIENFDPQQDDYELWYDRIVSYGELLSTSIISLYLNHAGVENKWLDMRRVFITDSRHRDANIDTQLSSPILLGEVEGSSVSVFIGQGFIGGTPHGEPTTLGREGSDYSAAVAAYILNAESVTIWKDVEGILNADPKIFHDTRFIPELTYLDAIELAYSGAQIIHPKTIKPLQNKNIPLYVRPFGDPAKQGSVIKGEIRGKIDVPILILKHNQVLISIRPNDFSFVLEDRFAGIFSMLEKYNIKINLIQSSAVNLSLSVDSSRHLSQVVEQLKEEHYRVVYNDNMELLTIRGYTRPLYEKYGDADNVYIAQKTRKIVRIVRKKT